MSQHNKTAIVLVGLAVIFLFAAGVCYPNAHSKIKPIERAISFTSIIDRLDEAVIVIDSNGNIELFSHGASRLLGVRSEDVLHKSFLWMMDDSIRDFHDKMFREKTINIDGKTMCTAASVHRWDHSKFKAMIRVKGVSLDDGKERGYFIHVIEAGKEVGMQSLPQESITPAVIPQP